MLDHLSIPVADIERAAAFYDAVLTTIGLSRRKQRMGAIGYGPDGRAAPVFWILEQHEEDRARSGVGLHISFQAEKRADVDAFHATALRYGGRDAGPPGVRPEYTMPFYGAFIYDLDNFKIEAVVVHQNNASLVAAIFLSVAAGTVTAASFSCERATNMIERMICASPEVSVLDEHLGRYYAAANEELGDGSNCLRDDQRRWLRKTRNDCSDTHCLRMAYLNRLAELDALQPGATAIKQYELPAVPTLVWVIPAALDTTAAPAKSEAPSLQARGRLHKEFGEGGRGYVLRTDRGERFGLVQDMFLEADTSTALDALARQDARFIARGYESRDDGNERNFEPSRCVFLYRLPAVMR